MGSAEQFHAWIKTHRKHMTIALVIVLILIFGFFIFLFMYFFFGDDLVLDLHANQASFRITNKEVANLQVNVTTAGQLFCTTNCKLALLDANSHSISVQEFNTTRGEVHTATFNLSPGKLGTGQSLYSAVATCTNIKSTFCPTSAPERRKTMLITVNYGLDTNETLLKPELKTALEGMLQQLQGIDISLQEIAIIISENPRLRTGMLLTNLTHAQASFADHNLYLENAKSLWGQEEYVALAQMQQTSNTTSSSMTALQEEVTGIYADLLTLPATHNALRLRIAAARNTLQDALETHEPLLADSNVTMQISSVVNETNNLTAQYEDDLFPSYAALQSTVESAETDIAALNASLIAQYGIVVQRGNDIIINEQLAACPNCTVSSNFTTLNDICVNITNTTFRSEYCVERNTSFINMTQLTPVIITIPNVTSTINLTLPDHAPTCCVFGECKACCSTCGDDPNTYPVIFVHGHSFNSFNSPEYSLGGYFTKIQQHLQEDGYVDAGILTPSSTLSEVEPGEWGLSGRPVTVRVTYYYNFYKNGNDYVVITQKSENIETYAIRLNELVKTVQHHTGKKKVNIVAHSMGGLVVRRYLQLFGEDDVDKIILIGTPNHGVPDRTQTLCPVFGESKECEDMDKDSVFMRKLNDPDNQPTKVKIVTIVGHGCPVDGNDGDGVVESDSVTLDGATNYDIDGECTDFFKSDLHTEMLNVDKYPQVYKIIRDELKK